MAAPIEPNEPSDVEPDLADLEHYRRRCHALETAVRGALAVLSVAADAGDEIRQPPSDFESGEQS
jgi:hypothetical protein